MAEAAASRALPQFRVLADLRQIPAVRQLATLIGLALAVAAGVALFTWSQQPNYVPVFPGLAEKDAADIADALRAGGTPMRLDPATGTVTVPADKVYEARMRLAAQGLPKGTAMGYEMIEQEQGLGTSQFIETARYQLALETELARTVGSLQSVKSARVHLALPKASPFVRRQDAASASVMVDLYPGRQLEAGQVSSIVHFVASSVPDLAPGAVTVIDQYGHLLTQNDSDSDVAQSVQQFEQTHRQEADYVRRIEDLLSPMLGAGRVSAQVAADMDFSVTEEARESYKPDAVAVRSEQSSEEMTRNPAQPSGVPGALSNQPPAAAAPAPASAAAAKGDSKTVAATTTTASGQDLPLSQSKTSTRNYEVDRTVSHTRQTVGRLRRLSVAVLVDNLPKLDAKTGKTTLEPLTPAELSKVESLVKEAVGFDAARGDSVSVQNAPFAAAEAASIEPLPLWQRPEVRDAARQVLGALVVLVLIFAVLRPLLRNLMGTARTASGMDPGGAPLHLASNGRVAEAEDRVSLGDGRGPPQQALPYEQKLATARGAVAQDPKRVAQLVKTWIGDDGG